MSKKTVPKITQYFYKKFTLIWILGTIVLLILALYINWQFSQKRSYRDISQVAANLSNNVDGFIEDLFQDVYTLPVYGNSFTDCKSGLSSYLERITLNNTKISGLTISDNKHRLLCSTLPNNEGFISSTSHSRIILGPFKLSMFDQPVYLVQQKMGNYHIGILVVSSVLESILKTPQDAADSVALHNQFDKKNIIRIEQNKRNHSWIYSKNLDALSPINSQSMYAIDKLQSINGLVVVVFENHKTVLYNLWYSEILVFLLIVFLSYFLYFLIKGIIIKRYSLHGALKLAVKNKEFYPEYQPLFDVEKQQFTGVEVLLRWQDNQDQIIMPDFFIIEAEKTGLIIPITLQIMEIAFKESRQILKKRPYFHLAFNLTALHFTDLTFFDKFNRLIDHYKIPPEQIIFEITERDLLDKNDKIFAGKMQELRDAGYSLAVDDYGTGHASISYLQHFPFNYLKIDKIFVQAIGTKAITESLNAAIIQMAKELNLLIIAEGVETEEQVNYLANNGVLYLQGWYFSKALPIEKLTDLLKGEK